MARQKRIKAGASKVSRAARERLFEEAYLKNGNNGTQAAITAGIAPKSAPVWASRALRQANVATSIAERTKETIRSAELSTDRWAQEAGYRAHFDPRELYDADGNLIPLHLLPEHVARAVNLEITLPDGSKLKTPNKETALADVGKHLGVFERDNSQRTSAIQVTVVLRG